MKRIALFLFILVPCAADAQQTRSPQIVQLFRPVVAKSTQSTVRILKPGDKGKTEDAALGVVISKDGFILTKYSELKSKITVKLHDGTTLDAELVNWDLPHDLAIIKVDAKDLTPIEWADSKSSKAGHWVASTGTGQDPVAIGVVSVPTREIKNAKFIPASGGGSSGYLGCALDLNFAGVKVQEVFEKTPAEKAGLKADDQILALNGENLMSTDEFLAILSKHKPGDAVKLKVLRNDINQDITVTLGTRPGTKGGKSRSDIQNNMGSKLSERRAGFPIVLQHDSVIKPSDCGGPLVNLDGRVVGVNISRAGRTETYAIPSETIRPLLDGLKKKRLD